MNVIDVTSGLGPALASLPSAPLAAAVVALALGAGATTFFLRGVRRRSGPRS